MFRRRDTESAAPGTPAPRPAGAPAARGPLLPSYPPREYLGQLDPAFQASLSKRREGADLSDLVWYHAFELPDGRVLPGAWDLRGHETAYLGGVDVAGKRVLELGPATGYLTFYMERMGAEVVSFEAGFDVSIDMLPVKGRDDPEGKLRVMQDTIDRNHDAWWYLHRTLGSSAKFVQGSIYDMPADLGTFDITLVGAILLHLREPWGALSQAAQRTTETMIVTEPLQDDLARSRVQHHAVLALGGAPCHQLVVDLSGRGRLHALPARLRPDGDDDAQPAPLPRPRHGERRHRPAHVHGGGATPGRLSRGPDRCAQKRPGTPRPRSTTEVRNSS